MSSTSRAGKAPVDAASAEPMPWPLLWAAALGSFAATCSGSARAPFLIDMARDLDTTLPLVANLFALTSISWGVTSLLAGMGSDRWGRRVFLVGGLAALALALIGVATGSDFLAVAIWATVAGGCSGVFTGVTFAEVSARVADHQRGRALGWVMSGMSLTMLVGVPLAAWTGAWIGWRGVNWAVAGLALCGALAMLATTRRPAGTSRAAGPAVSMRAVLTPMVLRLLAMCIADRTCFGLISVYFATFLQSTYGIGLHAVALPLALFATGNVVGTALGGQLADRFRNRLRIFALAMLGTGIAALALFGWPASLALSVALGFAYILVNALGRPALMAVLSNVPEHLRGTVMGLNGACASVGWLGAAALGGWMLAGPGFAGFGPLTAAIALIGAILALVRRG